MWPRRVLLVAAMACLGLVPIQSTAQDIGIVRSDILVMDPEQLFEETLLGKRMLADHQAQREQLASRNLKLVAELEAEEKRLTAVRADTSAEEFRDLADAFDVRVQEIRRDNERRVRDLERDRERLPVVFLRTVEPVLLDLMRDAGGTVLLDSRTVIFRAEAVDITQTAIARIDSVVGDGSESSSEEQSPDTSDPD